LLVEVKRAQITFLDDADRCRARYAGSFKECIEPSARNFGNVLREFSDWILKRKMPERTGV
jgi:hypothetical protein